MSERESLCDARCCCCGSPYEPRTKDDPWEGRLDGYCYECALARCDAYPGECPQKPVAKPNQETDEQFLERLKELGNNWRFSDEFIGIVVRTRYPRDYSHA